MAAASPWSRYCAKAHKWASCLICRVFAETLDESLDRHRSIGPPPIERSGAQQSLSHGRSGVQNGPRSRRPPNPSGFTGFSRTHGSSEPPDSPESTSSPELTRQVQAADSFGNPPELFGAHGPRVRRMSHPDLEVSASESFLLTQLARQALPSVRTSLSRCLAPRWSHSLSTPTT
jgi:hypothetical protein